jgi:hypothetical protein
VTTLVLDHLMKIEGVCCSALPVFVCVPCLATRECGLWAILIVCTISCPALQDRVRLNVSFWLSDPKGRCLWNLPSDLYLWDGEVLPGCSHLHWG